MIRNYFHRQIQSTQNDGCLTLGDGHQIKLDANQFPTDMINFEEKRVLVHTSQAATTKGKMASFLMNQGPEC
jgi:hypothetical protein